MTWQGLRQTLDQLWKKCLVYNWRRKRRQVNENYKARLARWLIHYLNRKFTRLFLKTSSMPCWLSLTTASNDFILEILFVCYRPAELYTFKFLLFICAAFNGLIKYQLYRLINVNSIWEYNIICYKLHNLYLQTFR